MNFATNVGNMKKVFDEISHLSEIKTPDPYREEPGVMIEKLIFIYSTL
jgi:hypothetical protein